MRMAHRLACLVLLFALALAGCTPAPVAPPPTPATLSAPATLAAPATTAPTATATLPATATLSAAASPTATPSAPTPTPAQAAAQPAGPLAAQSIKEFSGWCLAADAAVSYAKDPLRPPANARLGHIGQNTLTVRNLPSNGCTFLYTFTQDAPAGLKLEISELKQSKPFATLDLQPVSGRVDVVYAFVRHSYVINPPGSGIQLSYVVKDSLGQVLRRDQVNLYNWVPGTPAPKEEEDQGDCGCTIKIP